MNEIIVILGFLKIIYEFAVPTIVVILVVAAITFIKQDKYWLRKIFNKYIVDGRK